VFGINMVALVDGQPRLLSLKEMLDAFLRHRREVVTRRTVYELRKARERGHILEGLAIALANIDDIIATIKASPSPAEAKVALMSRTWGPGAVPQMLERAGAVSTRPDGEIAALGLHAGRYSLTETQAQAILEMRLNRLTGLEQDKIITEFQELLDQIRDLSDILARPERLLQVIRAELEYIRDTFGDKRRTEILVNHEDLTTEDLISPEDVVVTLSHGGYAKAQPVSDYQAQRRGGLAALRRRGMGQDPAVIAPAGEFHVPGSGARAVGRVGVGPRCPVGVAGPGRSAPPALAPVGCHTRLGVGPHGPADEGVSRLA
jgi:DNA gyrase subunit A